MTRRPLPMTARADSSIAAQFAADVRYYLSLTPRQLPSEYFYDALGSALFDAICRLPWYGITRAESRLLTGHSADIFRRIGGLTTIVELGPGNGDKLRLLRAPRGRVAARARSGGANNRRARRCECRRALCHLR
jgi:uncharacterized SAM-dependent methyltransferase